MVAPLLGKLYISPHSTEEKIRETYEEVTIAVNDRLVSDTTGRNALNKIHVSLGKIVANLGETELHSRRVSRSVSIAGEDKTDNDDRTVIAEPRIKEEDEESNATMRQDDESDEATVIPDKEKDTLVDELLTDEEA